MFTFMAIAILTYVCAIFYFQLKDLNVEIQELKEDLEIYDSKRI